MGEKFVEEIEDDVVAVVRRIARFIGRPRAAEAATAESIFRKIGERIDIEWACRFVLDLDAAARRAKALAGTSGQESGTTKA